MRGRHPGVDRVAGLGMRDLSIRLTRVRQAVLGALGHGTKSSAQSEQSIEGR